MLSLLINIAATFAPVSNIFRSPFTHYKHFIRNKFYTCTWYMVCWYKKIFLVHVQYYWKITRKETYCNYNSISELVLDSWFIFKCTDVMYNSTIIILIIRKKTIPKKKMVKVNYYLLYTCIDFTNFACVQNKWKILSWKCWNVRENYKSKIYLPILHE